MKINLEPKVDENIVIEKKQYENKEIFIQRITPHRNHKVFEYNKETKELSYAKFNNIPTIKWEDAVKENYGIYRKIIKTNDCIYFSALNFKNAVKVLKRDFNINI